jgi:hypothetical protein
VTKTNKKRGGVSPFTFTQAVAVLSALSDAVMAAYGKQFRNWFLLGQALNSGAFSIAKFRAEFEANGRSWAAVKADVSKARAVAKAFRKWERAKRFGNLNKAYASVPTRKARKRRASRAKRAEMFVTLRGKAEARAWANALLKAAK